MRVTLISETFIPQVNGVSRTLNELVRCLEELGDVVQVVHPDYHDPAPHEPGFRVHAVRVPFYRELRLPVPPFGPAQRAVASFQPDLIHIATEATLGLSFLGWARRLGLPVVSSFHTNFDQYSGHYGVGFARGLIWRYLRWFHNRTEETYVPSRATIRDLEGRGFERLVLWPRGVDSRLFRPDRPGRHAIRERLGLGPDDILIAYVGRIAAEKNIDYLVEAFRVVEEARRSVSFLFVGDGPERGFVEARLGARAHFAGYRTGDDLADHYAAADLFGFSSLTETFGNVVLEAMASGLPVVAVGAGGVGEIVRNGTNGLLVDPAAPPAALAELLLRLVDDDRLRRGMAEEARAHALAQSWSEIMERLRGRYQAVLDARSEEPTTAATV